MAPIRHYGGHFQEDGCETKHGWVAGRLIGGGCGPGNPLLRPKCLLGQSTPVKC